MSMSGKIKVKFIGKDMHGFVKGKKYDAYEVKSNIKNKDEMLGVINDYNEEYLCPKAWFELIC